MLVTIRPLSSNALGIFSLSDSLSINSTRVDEVYQPDPKVSSLEDFVKVLSGRGCLWNAFEPLPHQDALAYSEIAKRRITVVEVGSCFEASCS